MHGIVQTVATWCSATKPSKLNSDFSGFWLTTEKRNPTHQHRGKLPQAGSAGEECIGLCCFDGSEDTPHDLNDLG
jgi:hypothetical protein